MLHRRALIVGALLFAACGGSLFLLQSEKAPARTDRVDVDGVRFERTEVRASTYGRSTQANAALAVDETGVYVVWDSRRQQNGADGVYSQRFALDGKRIGGETQVNDVVRVQQRHPAIALGQHPVFGWDGLALRQTCYLRDLAGVSVPVQESRSGQSGLSLAGTQTGIVAVWLEDSRPFLRRGSKTTLVADDNATVVAVAAREGSATVVWAGARGIAARKFDAAGEPSGPAFAVSEGDSIEPSCSMDSDGGLAVSWLARSPSQDGYDVWMRRYDPLGRALGEPVLVNACGKHWQSGAACAVAQDGRVCVAWNHEDLGRNTSSIHARFVDRAGGLGSVFGLTVHDQGAQRLLTASGARCLEFGPQGHLFAAWSGDGGFGDASAAHLTILTPQEQFKEDTAEAPAPHDPPFYTATPPGTPAANAAGLAGTGPDFGFRALSRRALTPPDPHIAAGTSHLSLVTNDEVAIYTKTGTRLWVSRLGGTSGFWSVISGTGFVFDPETHWDPHAKRFLIFANERSGGKSYFLLAISKDDTPTDTKQWWYYRFDVTTLADIGSGGSDIDSPNLGMDANAYYMSADFFRGGLHHLIFIIDKKNPLAGKQPATTKSLVIKGTASYGLPVQWGTSPAQYLVQHFSSSSNTKIRLHAITGSLTSPKLTSTDITVPSYGRPGPLRSKGTTRTQTTFAARFWSCVWRNGSLWACHHAGSTPKAIWYEIKTSTWPASGKPSLVQSGTIDMGTGVNTVFNAITVDGDGNALSVFAVGSANHYLSIGRAWRAASDTKGTMRAPQIVQANTAAYTISRWGDYGGAAADPVEPNTIWYTHEYAPTSNVWSTWIGKTVLKPFAADKLSISEKGGTVNFTLDNPSHAGKAYLIVATCSGTSPGTKLGGLTVPINWDPCSDLFLSQVNTALLPGFLGKLDANGVATAKAVAPAVPGAAGLTLDFAYVQDGNVWSFASNPVQVKIVK